MLYLKANSHHRCRPTVTAQHFCGINDILNLTELNKFNKMYFLDNHFFSAAIVTSVNIQAGKDLVFFIPKSM